MARDATSKVGLMSAGRELFSERGYAATATRDLLERANANAPSLYHHFGSKAGLYFEVAKAVDDEIALAFRSSIVGKTRFLDRLDAVLDATLDLHASDVSMVNLMSALPVEIRQNADLARIDGLKRIRGSREFIVEMCEGSTDLAVPPAFAANAVMTLIYGLGRSGPMVDRREMKDIVAALRDLAHGALVG